MTAKIKPPAKKTLLWLWYGGWDIEVIAARYWVDRNTVRRWFRQIEETRDEFLRPWREAEHGR